MTDAWALEPKPVPAELEAGYAHEFWPLAPVKFPDVYTQLTNADSNTLRLLANGGAGNLA